MPRKNPSSIGVPADLKRHLEAFSKMNDDADWWWLARLCLRYGVEHGDEVIKNNGDRVSQRILEYLIREGLR
jgi:hypothetical protein